jgi:hypothetical protein
MRRREFISLIGGRRHGRSRRGRSRCRWSAFFIAGILRHSGTTSLHFAMAWPKPASLKASTSPSNFEWQKATWIDFLH